MLKCNQRRAIRNCRSSLLQVSSNVEAEHVSYVHKRRSACFCEMLKMRIGNCVFASNLRIQYSILGTVEMEHTQAYRMCTRWSTCHILEVLRNYMKSGAKRNDWAGQHL